MTHLATVHPDGRVDCHLEEHHRRWAGAVARIWHEARVSTRGKFHARGTERGLRGGVVLRHEVELNHVADRSSDGVGRVDETGGATDSDLMRGQSCQSTQFLKIDICLSDLCPHLMHLSSSHCLVIPVFGGTRTSAIALDDDDLGGSRPGDLHDRVSTGHGIGAFLYFRTLPPSRKRSRRRRYL
jgi:hypothetical protein